MRAVIFTCSALLAMVLVSCSVSSGVEVAKGVNFNNYKTFGWAITNGVTKSGRSDNDIVDNNIKNAVGAELEAKGWVEADSHPDVLLDYNIMVEKGVRTETDPVYPYPYSGYFYSPWRGRRGYFYNPYFLAGYRTYNVPFTEGTLTVNMIDAKTNKLIWQGWAKGDVANRGITSQQAETDVKSIFKRLNLPKQ